MIKAARLLLSSLLILTPSFFWAAPPVPDSLEGLIEEETQARDEWGEDPTPELPVVFMRGDMGAVQILSSSPNRKSASLCTPMELDEVMQLSLQQVGEKEIELNTDMQRVRESIEDACLIRPGDEIFAVTRGTQRTVRVDKFLVRKDRPQCTAGTSYSLWMKVVPPLEDDPIFYTTAVSTGADNNFYLAADSLAERDLDDALKSQLRAHVPFLKDFRIQILVVGDPSLKEVVFLKRQSTSPDDEDLPNEILFAVRDNTLFQLAMERVDSEIGSGRVSFQGVLDFNHDGFLDIEIRGFHGSCPTFVMAQGTTLGWTLNEIPDILP